MFQVHFEGSQPASIEVEREQSLLVLAKRAGAAGTHSCGGHGRCGTCRVQVTEGAEHLTPMGSVERNRLEAGAAAPDERLACQAWARGPVRLRFTSGR